MRIFSALIIIGLSHTANAQFPNHSFEIHTGVPQLLGEWSKTESWNNAGSDIAAPDYYMVGASPACDLPETPFGLLSAYNGKAMVGIALCGRNNTNQRTYLQCQLTSPLVRGKKYKFSFYLSNGKPTETSVAGLAVDHIGVFISAFAPVQTGQDPLYFSPQFSIDTVFYSETWKKISFEYIPLIDDEKYFTFGLFGSDSNRDIVNKGLGNPQLGYYFVDDFACIEIDGDKVPDENLTDKGPAPKGSNTVYVPNSFTPNGDGQNDLFIPVADNVTIESIEIFSRWGEPIFKSKDRSNQMWDGMNGKNPCQEGVYYFIIKYEDPKSGDEGSQTGYVTLLR